MNAAAQTAQILPAISFQLQSRLDAPLLLLVPELGVVEAVGEVAEGDVADVRAVTVL